MLSGQTLTGVRHSFLGSRAEARPGAAAGGEIEEGAGLSIEEEDQEGACTVALPGGHQQPRHRFAVAQREDRELGDGRVVEGRRERLFAALRIFDPFEEVKDAYLAARFAALFAATFRVTLRTAFLAVAPAFFTAFRTVFTADPAVLFTAFFPATFFAVFLPADFSAALFFFRSARWARS